MEIFDKFGQFFILDPLLLQVCVYICPKKDLPVLFQRIPPVLSTVWLAHMALFSGAGAFNKSEVHMWSLNFVYVHDYKAVFVC